MREIIVAAYYRLAGGFESTLSYIASNIVEVAAINTYLENVSVESQVQVALGQFEAEEQILVFTDLLGGSVNQTFAKFLDRYNTQLIADVSLPILMTLTLTVDSNDLSEATIRQAIEKSRQRIVYVNDLL